MEREKDAFSREMTAYGRLEMRCLYVAETITKCLLEGGVSLREVSVRAGSTVLPLPGV